MSITNDGERIVLAETTLPPSNPRGLTPEFVNWNMKNIPVFGAGDSYAKPLNVKVLAIAGAVILGFVLILKRRG